TRLGEVTLHRGAPENARTFEAPVVRALEVGDVDAPRDRVHHHVEEDRADVVEGGRRGERVRVEAEDVVVGQAEVDQRGPVPAARVAPRGAVELEEDADLRRR